MAPTQPPPQRKPETTTRATPMYAPPTPTPPTPTPIVPVVEPPPMPPRLFRLPLILTCAAVEPGAPTVLDCVLTDAAGQVVRARGGLRINVSQSTTYEQAAAVLQSYASTLGKDLLASGKAERVVSDNPEVRLAELQSIVNKLFIGSSA